MNKEEDFVVKKDWEEFRESGLLWFINSILHLFGWSIAFQYEGKCIEDVYPVRVKYRGFSEDINDKGYKRVTEYLKNNINSLMYDMNDIKEGEIKNDI